MRLTELNVYPLKSGGGTAMRAASLTAKGLRYDREFMLVTSGGKMMTQRKYPRMALLRPVYDGTVLTVGEFVHRPVDNGVVRDVTVWDDPCLGIDQGDGAAAWFSEFLQVECRLVRFSGHRTTELGYGEAAFSDGFPLLLISQESLDDLNSRLGDPLPMNRFRPNLVVSGLGPFGEDRVRTLRIGDVVIDLVKPCGRCVLTTVDQSLGVKGREPLRTLATYRTIDQEIQFGQNAIPRSLGTLRVGDPIEILEGHQP